MVEILKPTFRMQLNYKLLFFFFTVLNVPVLAQEVQLDINASSYSGKTAYIWIDDDHFTGHKLLIDEKVIEDDSVAFTIKTDKILRVKIGIDYQYATMYVQPGSSYTISFPRHDPKNNRSLAWNTKVMLSYMDLPENDINAQVMQLNSELDLFFTELLVADKEEEPTSDPSMEIEDSLAFTMEAPANFSQKESLEKFTSFINEWNEEDSIDSDFYNVYKEYTGASISYSLGEKRELLYSRYLEGKAIDYNNPEYAYFFNDFYANYLDSYAYYPLSEKLKKAFDADDIKASLKSLIGADSQTGNEQLQELVLMKALYDYRSTHQEKDSLIISIFSTISNASQYAEHKLIATNYLQKINKGKVGSDFPFLQYISYTGDTIQLSPSVGRITYLQIFATWNSSSLAELELMNELYKKYNSQVQFISLSIDPDLSTFNEFVKKHREYKWELAWIGVHPQSLEDLSVYSVPLFYLLDEDLKVIESPALWPSTGIEKVFFELDLKKKEEKKYRFWENQSNKSIKEE